jgi:hypothetical protein
VFNAKLVQFLKNGNFQYTEKDRKHQEDLILRTKSLPGKRGFITELRMLGAQLKPFNCYLEAEYRNLVKSFQSVFRDWNTDGRIDVETASILRAVVDNYILQQESGWVPDFVLVNEWGADSKRAFADGNRFFGACKS